MVSEWRIADHAANFTCDNCEGTDFHYRVVSYEDDGPVDIEYKCDDCDQYFLLKD